MSSHAIVCAAMGKLHVSLVLHHAMTMPSGMLSAPATLTHYTSPHAHRKEEREREREHAPISTLHTSKRGPRAGQVQSRCPLKYRAPRAGREVLLGGISPLTPCAVKGFKYMKPSNSPYSCLLICFKPWVQQPVIKHHVNQSPETI